VTTVRQLAWVAFTVAAVSAGCSTSLREIRARDPDFRFEGVAASRHFAVARCIRDVLEQVGADSVAYEIAQDHEGTHVIGRPDESLSVGAVFFDVAVREDEVVVRMAPTPVVSREALRYAVTVCVGG
jgi:hypothetical protein